MALPQPGKTCDGDATLAGEHQFRWEDAENELARLPGGGVNLAHELVDRHVAEGRAGRPALRWIGRRHTRLDISYGELADLTARAARVLRQAGIQPGDVVAVMLPRLPELFVAALGAWKAGAVFCPLFASFGPGPVKSRLEISRAKLLIAGDSLYARTVAGNRPLLPDLAAVLLVGEDGGAAHEHEDCLDFRALLAAADPAGSDTAATAAGDAAWLHFTSGTAGIPKGALHSHRAVLALKTSGRQVFGLGPDDVYWCTAESGWVTATAYGIVAPLACGCLAVVAEGEFDPRRWYTILRDEGVTAWYTTPTAIRMMMRYGAALARSYRPTRLRVAASCGEPLNPEAVAWGEKTFGVPFLDTWWQTETGAIAVANLPGAARAGSMGRALPGFEVAVVHRTNGGVTPVAAPDQPGELAVRDTLPSLFTGYLGDPERTKASFADGWYLSGDLVRRDADGFFWFLGRSDDMIKSASQSIGPFEVESALLDHPAVAEIGVIGRPDLLLREVPVAYVSLNPGFEAGEALRLELLTFARQQLGPALAPQEIHFVAALPKTSSGKIVRRALRSTAVGEVGEMEPLPRPRPSCYDDE